MTDGFEGSVAKKSNRTSNLNRNFGYLKNMPSAHRENRIKAENRIKYTPYLGQFFLPKSIFSLILCFYPRQDGMSEKSHLPLLSL
jgi:hypothetical protein